MARIRRSIQPLDLFKYDVLIEEKGMRSDYFKITQFDGYFYGGRNAFLVAGSGVFKSNSKILVEVLHRNNETVYSAPVSSFVEGNSRLIEVEIYNDTPIGPGKIILLGSVDTYLDGTPVPDEWKGKYNIRWITDVVISPLVKNKTPIRFEKTPSLFVSEKFYAAPSSSQYTETISFPVDVQLSPKYFNVFPNGYLLKLTGPSENLVFKSDYIGGRLTGSFSFIGSTGIQNAQVNLPINKIYNENVAESEGSLIYTDKNTLITSLFLSSSGNYTSNINSEFASTVSSSLNLVYSKLETAFTGSGLSFAEIRIVDLETISGEINSVRLSFKNSTNPGEYVLLGDVNTGVRELFAIDSGSSVVNTGDFTKIALQDYWYAATMSLAKNDEVPTIPSYYLSSSLVQNDLLYKNNSDIIDAVSATPSIVNNNFIDNKSYFIGTRNLNFATLFPRSEYTLAFDAFASITSGSESLNQNDYSMEVYLVPQEGTNSKILTTDPRGQFLGTVTPSATFKKQNFERVELNFVPKIQSSGKYGLRFVVYGGHWSISNVSVKVAEEPFFSPDEINVLVPIQNTEQDILTFKAEFLDINNNTAGVSVVSIPTYFTGSSDYVKKIGDSMTGELYIKGLPIQQQALQDSFTGLVSGGVITVNTPASWSYTISSGSGYVVDNYTNPFNPTYTYVTWPQITKMPDAFVTTGSIASYPRTNIAISSSGQLIEQSAEWTTTDYRKYIILGRIAHVGTTSIQRALSLPLTTYNRGFHWFDLANAIGIINVEGNVYYASGSSMSIGKTSGKTYRVGSNYRNDTTFPDITTDPSSLPVTFSYRYRSGSVFAETPLTTIITGSVYDNGSGILATVNPNKFTVQRIYYFGATNTTRIQFGQNEYNTLIEAQDGAVSEQFAVDPNLERDSSLRAFLIVGSSTTDLSNLTEAEFIPQGKFGSAGGSGGGGGGGASTLAGLTDVSITGLTSGQYLQYNGTSWINNGLSGSLFGTSSWASNSISSSFATSASVSISSSRALTSSFSISSSFAQSTILPSGVVSSSAQVSYTQLQNIPTGIVSSSVQVTALLPAGTVSSSLQINTGSFSGSITSASFAVSSSRAVTSSFAISSSIAQALSGGSTNYVPLWTSATAQSSSTIYQSAGNIGIGTTSPLAKLEVAVSGTSDASIITGIFGKTGGNAYGSTVLRVARYVGTTDLTVATPVEALDLEYNSGGNGPFRYGTYADAVISNEGGATNGPYGAIHFTTSGSIRMTVGGGTLAGNVGIGTTSPDSILHMASPSTLNWKLQNTGAGGATVASYAGVSTGSIGTLSNHPLFLYTNNIERVRIDNNGNVGIGSTTPSAKLTILGNVSVTTAGRIGFYSENDTFTLNGYTTAHYGLTHTNAVLPVVLSGYYGLEFATTGTSRMIISSSGNVGIGTTNPQTKLDVNGTISIGGYARLSGSNAYTTVLRPDGGIAMYLGDADAINYYDNTAHYFRDRSFNARMVINSTTGNVGIGTTSPSAKLHVVGDVSASILHVSGTLGQSLTQTSSSIGVGDYIYDTGITVTSLVPDGPSIYELIAQYNPNTAGSVVYRNILHGHIYIEDGYDGIQNVVTVEYNELYRAIGSSSYDGSGANVNVSFVNTTNAAISTESTTVPYASGSWQMRIRFSNNSTPPGTPSYRAVRLLRKL
jgi:hypothetical protein